jgi:hypothetical protein
VTLNCNTSSLNSRATCSPRFASSWSRRGDGGYQAIDVTRQTWKFAEKFLDQAGARRLPNKCEF